MLERKMTTDEAQRAVSGTLVGPFCNLRPGTSVPLQYIRTFTDRKRNRDPVLVHEFRTAVPGMKKYVVIVDAQVCRVALSDRPLPPDSRHDLRLQK
jgi:hypothetical protein